MILWLKNSGFTHCQMGHFWTVLQIKTKYIITIIIDNYNKTRGPREMVYDDQGYRAVSNLKLWQFRHRIDREKIRENET